MVQMDVLAPWFYKWNGIVLNRLFHCTDAIAVSDGVEHISSNRSSSAVLYENQRSVFSLTERKTTHTLYARNPTQQNLHNSGDSHNRRNLMQSRQNNVLHGFKHF